MTSTTWQSRRSWILAATLAAFLLIAASWFLLISPKLDSTDSLRGQRADVDLQNSRQALVNAKLKKEYENIDTLRAQLGTQRAGLPAGSGLPEFTSELTRAAADTSIDLTSIAVNGITPVAAAVATAPAAGSDSTSASPTPTPTPTGTAAATAAGTQFSIGVTLQTTGTYRNQAKFLDSVVAGSRRVLVTATQIGVAQKSRVTSTDGITTMTTQLTVFSASLTAQQAKQLQQLISPSGR